jgi:hypothetical protein
MNQATKTFADEAGASWSADAREEHTPRHHGRWYLVFQGPDGELPMPEVRWQTRETALRTLQTMSDFELRRRLHVVRERALLEHGASPDDGAPPEAMRARTSVNAG